MIEEKKAALHSSEHQAVEKVIEVAEMVISSAAGRENFETVFKAAVENALLCPGDKTRPNLNSGS